MEQRGTGTSRLARIAIAIVLAFVFLLCVTFLVNIPDLHANEGLPLFPAVLVAEAMLLGAALCAYGVYAILLKPLLGQRRLENSRSKPGRQPWLDNAQWAAKRVTYSSVGKVVFLWFFTFNWWGALVFFAQDRGSRLVNESVPVLILCVVLVLIGVLTVHTVIKKTIEWLRFGRSALVIDTLPGMPGQTFQGRIETGFRKRPQRAISLRLTGFTRHWSERAYIPHEENRRVTDVRESVPFFEDEQKISPLKLVDMKGRITIPVRFDIPSGAPSSGLVDGDMEVIWRINASSTGKEHPPYEGEFDIPVFDW